MAYKNLTVEKTDHIAVVKLNRPDKSNALSLETMREIRDLAEGFNDDEETRVVVFMGEGRNFSVGVDLGDDQLVSAMTGGSRMMKSRRLKIGPELIRSVLSISQMTIAAIDGFALGGGACLAAACDFRIGSSECRVGLPEVNLAMNLSWRALPLFVRLIGPSRTKRMVILAQKENAQTLHQWGFLDEVTEPEELSDRAMQMARLYAAQAPMAAQMVKQSVNMISNGMDDAIMHMDSDQFLYAISGEDFKEGVNAFFEKRTPEFKGD